MLAVTAFIAKSDAQVVGIKTNLVQWATVSPNLGVEIGLGKQTTLDISAGFNPFKFSHDRQWRHWMVQPEFRWWTCERFNGHFLGVHMIGGGFNVGNVSFFPFSTIIFVILYLFFSPIGSPYMFTIWMTNSAFYCFGFMWISFIIMYINFVKWMHKF